MFKTKKEVDAHVCSAMSKLRSDSERDLRGLTVAKLYYKINEYATAVRYLLSYFNVKKDNDQAHKLIGQCYLRLKKPDKALESFQHSLQLNPKQPDLLIEVCQLLLDDTNLNTNSAKYWCELAEKEKVSNDIVFSLRLKLLDNAATDSDPIENILQKEIQARPNDVLLRTRLLRFYLEKKRFIDAFNYAFKLEMNMNEHFNNSSDWYNVVLAVISQYEQIKNVRKDWDYWLLLIICAERQVNISFSTNMDNNNAAVTESANLLFNFDQYLFKLAQCAEKLSGTQSELITLCLEHYRGQLLLHMSALLFKRELVQNKNKWKETVQNVLPILLLGYHIDASDFNQPWMKHSDEQGKKLIQMWQREASFRCAQLGRTLLSCVFNEKVDKENVTVELNTMLGRESSTLWESSDDLLKHVRQTCGDKHWRRQVFPLLYFNSDQKMKEQSSWFINSPKLQVPNYEWPQYADVEHYEDIAQYLKPYSLTHMVYLCLANENLFDVRAKYFSGLNYTTQNLSYCGAETINQLDVDSFLYAATIQAKRILEVERDSYNSYNSDNRNAVAKPRILPLANMPPNLCTEGQTKWWLGAYKVYKSLTDESNLSELRSQLQSGLEVIRGINGPKADLFIMLKLGQLFVLRSQGACKSAEKSALEARADLIYKQAINMLKKHQKDVLEPFGRYFKYVKSNCNEIERAIIISAEDAVSYLGARYFKKSQYEELIEDLNDLSLPTATYMQAEAYRKLDELHKTSKKSKCLYYDRRNECLQQTQQLLKHDPDHPLSSLISNELQRSQQLNGAKIGHDNTSYVNSPIDFHNNSSTYEDAENEFYAEASPLPLHSNRSRRETALISAPRNSELESLVRQMASTLSFVKDEIVDNIKPEMLSMRNTISTLKDKIMELDDAVKKLRITSTSNPPSRDDGSHVLDDLYIIEDALQNQLFQSSNQQQQQQSATNLQHLFPNVPNATSPFAPQQPLLQHQPQPMPQQPQQQQQQQQQQQRFYNQNVAAAAAVAAAAHYNSPIFNPNGNSMNPYAAYTSPVPAPSAYMQLTPQPPTGAGNSILNQRNPSYPMNFYTPPPYMDASNGLNFGMQPPTPLLPPLIQPTMTSIPSQFMPPQASITTPITTNAGGQPQLQVTHQQPASQIPSTTQTTILSSTNTPAAPALVFNKALNNQPVEKGPPANVVITSSDPLPKPSNSAQSTAQQPTLSVTIPSHHIKQSLVQTPEAINPHNGSNINNVFAGVGSGFSGFGTGSFSGFGNNSLFGSSTTTATPTTLPTQPTTTIAAVTDTTAFSFKPQVALAAAAAAAAAAQQAESEQNESYSSDVNKSSDGELEYDPRPDFMPIIPLPDEVEVKTGEEDETVMFCYRAKLYRHVDKEWKERGIGDIKILRNKEGYSRILMRRDQTHKICANHKITPELSLTQPEKDNKAIIWAANDFADEEIRVEKFFARFKLVQQAIDFKNAFNKAKKEATDLDNSKANSDKVMPPPTNVTATAAPPPFGLSKSAAVNNFVTSTPATSYAAAIHTQTKTVNAPTSTAAQTTSSAKSLFGGTVSKTTDAIQKTTASVSPFANFSFGQSSHGLISTPSAKSSTDTTVAVTTPVTASPFANIFSNLAKNDNSTASIFSIGDGANANIFQTPNSITAAADSSTTAPLNKSNASDTEDDYVPTAQFKPVIPLPDLIEVNTGEENELVLFEYRAKLLRFDKETGEWKERGLGNIKLLQDKSNVNQVRLVMRREQIHKLCCNQRLCKETVFNYAKNSQTALTWAAQDFAEEELSTQLLTIRFKTAEKCKEFHAAILKAQEAMTSTEDTETKSDTQPVEKLAQETQKGFGDAFKPKAGSWSCNGCYVTNKADSLYCLACDSPKDDTVPKKEAAATNLLNLTASSKFNFGFGVNTNAQSSIATTTAAVAIKPNFSFAAQPTSASSNPKPAFSTVSSTTTTTAAAAKPGAGFGDQFKPKEGSWVCQSCYLSNTGDAVYCSACEAPKDETVPKKDNAGVLSLTSTNTASKFNFGFGAIVGSATVTKSEPTKSLFSNLTSGGEASKSFTFTLPTATSTTLNDAGITTSAPATSSTTFSFTIPTTTDGNSNAASFALNKKDFNFTMKPKSPGKATKSPSKVGASGFSAEANEEGGEDDDYQDEEENNTYFTPVIPLPDKIDVKTGEENEEMLYVHRAKLYRHINGEWKERGLGDVKILRHKETKKLRIVMRREQILKICLNHVLDDQLDYQKKDDKSWLFVVNDFSEGEYSRERFSLRFKNKDIANDFMEAVKSALAGTAKVIAEMPKNSINNPMETTAKISEEERKLAKELQLPFDFFTAKSTCVGCRGCDPEAFVFTSPKTTEPFDMAEVQTELPLILPVLDMPASTAQQNLSVASNTPTTATLTTPNRTLLKQSALTTPTNNVTPISGNNKMSENIFSGFGGANSTALGGVVGNNFNNDNQPAANITFSFTAAAQNLSAGSKTEEVKSTAPVSSSTGSGGFLFGGGGVIEKNPIFGQTPSIFGGSNTTTSSNDASKSIFGGGTIFGGTASNSSNLFGGNTTTQNTSKSGSIFGNNSLNANTTPNFGAKPSIFGSTPIFGSVGAAIKSETTSDNNSSLFGGQSSNALPSFSSADSTFGANTAMTGMNSTNINQNSLFQGSNGSNTTTSLFGGVQFDSKSTSDNNVTPIDFSDLAAKTAAGDDFASLAAKAATTTIKPFDKVNSGSTGFIGLKNQNAFQNFLSPCNKSGASNNNDSNTGGSGADDNDENYDPHYEPIIALPNEIVVSTGEEDETKLFGERAMLFRWNASTREWKERGVGELKILLHPAKKTYRMVMRREQIHKLVLNHAIGDNFSFKNMNNNPKSFVWGAMNFAESADGELENLAVRFKKQDLADQFAKTLNQCIASTKENTA